VPRGGSGCLIGSKHNKQMQQVVDLTSSGCGGCQVPAWWRCPAAVLLHPPSVVRQLCPSHISRVTQQGDTQMTQQPTETHPALRGPSAPT
jgi:hypothetical protein